jgi:hypothetical protein
VWYKKTRREKTYFRVRKIRTIHRSDFFIVRLNVGFIYPVCSPLDWIDVVMAQSLFFVFIKNKWLKIYLFAEPNPI